MCDGRAPLYEALLRTVGRSRFHVPAHGAAAWVGEPRERFAGVLAVDQTEIPGLDDLHHAEGVVRQAEEGAARAFGALRTRFLVGGATAGVLAAVLAVSEGRPEGVWLAGRDAHQSFYHALMFAGAEAVLIAPEIDAYGRPLGYDWSRFCDVVRREAVRGVFLTTPTYFGQHRPLGSLIRCLRAKDIPVIVDQAHGGHFGLHAKTPPSALREGADVVVHSTHKSLGALTMAAMLHLGTRRVDADAVDSALLRIQSSSPSYPLLASLDLVQKWIHDGTIIRLLEQAVDVAQALEAELSSALPGVVLSHDDPLRLPLVAPRGLGSAMAEALGRRGVDVELVFGDVVLAVVGLGTTMEDVRRLLDGVAAFWQAVGTTPKEAEGDGRAEHAGPSAQRMPQTRPIGESLRWPPEERVRFTLPRGRRTRLPFHMAVGAVLAESLVPYPPGIPWAFAGTRLDGETIALIEGYLAAGGRVHGVGADRTVSVMV
ncbi:MAG: hypothetical protein IMW86_08795 [Hydrogenibacillus sp.]|nr:hypothetical protein [Hydrogenibacillus sp.]